MIDKFFFGLFGAIDCVFEWMHKKKSGEVFPMEITLTLNLKQYQKEKFEGEYIPVHFLYEVNDSIRIEKDVRIKARGQFRREHCTFAPFWLNIRKADVANEHLQDVKRMKVVTHCNGGKSYSEYVLKEYLAYKIYNLIIT